MPTKNELLAHGKSVDEMCEKINATTLKFLSLEGLYTALISEKNPTYPQFSDHYFTGDYPVKPEDNLNSNIRLKQLSLLSGKSNS